MTRDPLNPRAEELLAERALRPLDDNEHWELQQLGVADDESFDRAAAAVVVATTVIEPMPSDLAERILAAAAGGNDWKRTLPGVVMPPLPDQARDTVVSMDTAEVAAAAELASAEQPKTAPLIAQKEPPGSGAKLMGVPAAAVETLPPPATKRPPAIMAPSLVGKDDKPVTPAPSTPAPPTPGHAPGHGIEPLPPVLPVRPPSQPGLTPLPQDSTPFSVDTPPMAVPISRERGASVTPPSVLPPEPTRASAPSRDELARRRGAERRKLAETVPLRRARRSVAPWLFAAACLVVAGVAVWWGLDERAGHPTPTPGSAAPLAANPAGDRAALLASATDVTKITWTITQDPNARGATGDVVWSAAQQRGYMRFVGLAPNDPTQTQYQLWIFDKTRDQAFPVDGGVFDVPTNGEVIVPITAKLRVNDLALFAVTVEKPGGVVVSKRERIVVTAARS